MTLHTKQMSDSFRIGVLLAIVGGFLDTYTYLCRGQVFANAQTGNIVLMGIHLFEGDFWKASSYFIPIFAFMLGVLLDEGIKHHFENKVFHWRQMVLLIEVCALVIVMLLPLGSGDAFANALVSFICSLQVQSFRKVHGLPYASTMCTGNLRSGTEHLVHFFKKKEKTFFKKSMHYYGIIISFICGAGLGVITTKRYGNLSLWICFLLLLVAFCMLFVKETNETT